MDASISRTLALPDFTPPISRSSGASVYGSAGRPNPLSRQLDTVREMLWVMDTLTMAGQRHSMRKIVGFIEDHVHRLGALTTPRNQEMLAEVSSQLKLESERRWPDVRSFSVRAESVIGLLQAMS